MEDDKKRKRKRLEDAEGADDDASASDSSSRTSVTSSEDGRRGQDASGDRLGSPKDPIRTPRYKDILLGRGRGIQSSNGNFLMREVTGKHRDRYKSMARSERRAYSEMVLDEILKTGARFLKRVDDGDTLGVELWEEVTDRSITHDKVSHSLRERQSAEYREQKKASNATTAATAAAAAGNNNNLQGQEMGGSNPAVAQQQQQQQQQAMIALQQQQQQQQMAAAQQEQNMRMLAAGGGHGAITGGGFYYLPHDVASQVLGVAAQRNAVIQQPGGPGAGMGVFHPQQQNMNGGNVMLSPNLLSPMGAAGVNPRPDQQQQVGLTFQRVPAERIMMMPTGANNPGGAHMMMGNANIGALPASVYDLLQQYRPSGGDPRAPFAAQQQQQYQPASVVSSSSSVPAAPYYDAAQETMTNHSSDWANLLGNFFPNQSTTTTATSAGGSISLPTSTGGNSNSNGSAPMLAARLQQQHDGPFHESGGTTNAGMMMMMSRPSPLLAQQMQLQGNTPGGLQQQNMDYANQQHGVLQALLGGAYNPGAAGRGMPVPVPATTSSGDSWSPNPAYSNQDGGGGGGPSNSNRGDGDDQI